MQAIKQFFKTHPHAWWGAYLPVYLAMFFTIEHFITDNYWATQTVLDTYIPFCEWFIFPYVSWSPLLVVLGIYLILNCLLYTSPSPRDRTRSRMPSSA